SEPTTEIVLDRPHRELGGIEDDLRGRLAHGEGDRLDAGERRRHQIRLEPDLVTCWDDVTRKPVEIHGLVASWTVDGTIRTLPHAAGHVVTLLRSSRHRQGHRVPSRS